MEKLKQIYIKNKEVINYLIFGICTTIINFITYYCCTKIIGIEEIISNIIAWCIGVIFAYITNKIFVFESKRKKGMQVFKELVSFILARVFTGIFCEVALFALLLKVLKIYDIVSKIITQVIVVILNYLFSKLIVFKNR